MAISHRFGLMAKFRSQNQNSQRFSSEQLRGNYTLLMFGYTHCTDICPTALRYRMKFQKKFSKRRPGEYAIDHSAFLYLLDKKASPLDH